MLLKFCKACSTHVTEIFRIWVIDSGYPPLYTSSLSLCYEDLWDSSLMRKRQLIIKILEIFSLLPLFVFGKLFNKIVGM